MTGFNELDSAPRFWQLVRECRRSRERMEAILRALSREDLIRFYMEYRYAEQYMDERLDDFAALRRFENLQCQHKATERDFFDLVRLLHRVGCSTEAEYCLRCNLLVAKDEQSPYEDDKDRLSLYVELFGTAKQAEFAAAIAVFSKQFSAKLTRGAGTTFWLGYHTVPRRACFTKYRMRNEPCYVRFEYEKRDTIEAWLECLSDEDQLLKLGLANGIWEILGGGVLTKVYDDGRRRTKRCT